LGARFSFSSLCFALFLLLITATLAFSDSSSLARSVTIHRDTFGVPHIRAKTDAGAVFGLMYAQAEDNFWQLETDMARITGRAAELDGAKGLATDILVRAYESEEARERGLREGHSAVTRSVRCLCCGRQLLSRNAPASEATPDYEVRTVVHSSPKSAAVLRVRPSLRKSASAPFPA
jgi:hypothetical protein